MRLDEVTYLIPLWLLRTTVFVFGLLWGSFLNVVIYRVPRDMSVVRPASHCPGCGKPIAGYDNVPVLGYLLLRGRARCCGVKMSPRYPIVELIGGALALAILEAIVLRLPPSTSLAQASAVFVADFALALGLVAAAFIDAEHMFLPDSITIGGAVIGVVTATLRGMRTTESLVGAVAGFGGIWLPFVFLYRGFTGRTGMGMGDAKLMALAGSWFGWPGALFTLLAGAVHGTVYAGITKALGIEPKLPEAVLEDIAGLEKLAAEGDEEARKALLEDPLTEEEDPFILRWLGLWKRPGAGEGSRENLNLNLNLNLNENSDSTSMTSEERGSTQEQASVQERGSMQERGSNEEESEEVEADTRADTKEEEPKARLPFGPFLILAMLELLFVGDWIRERLLGSVWPP